MNTEAGSISKTELLQAALIGFERQRTSLDEKIQDLRTSLNQPNGKRKAAAKAVNGSVTAEPSKRKMSAAGRKAIADAQRKRWRAKRKAERAQA